MSRAIFRHFEENVQRARALVACATRQPAQTPEEQLLHDDLLRSAWMFVVGAFDAYFCDAYGDLIAATIIAQQRQANSPVTLPDFFLDIRVPIRAVLQNYQTNTNWRWRMAARKLMERENTLGLSTIQDRFNKFLPQNRKLFNDVLPALIQDPQAKKRLFGVTAKQFRSLIGQPRDQAVKDARKVLDRRFRDVIQRRHDCIHACDRPRSTPQVLGTHGSVSKVIDDIEFVVTKCESHLLAEFPIFLKSIGCTPTTITQVGY